MWKVRWLYLFISIQEDSLVQTAEPHRGLNVHVPPRDTWEHKHYWRTDIWREENKIEITDNIKNTVRDTRNQNFAFPKGAMRSEWC